MVTQKKFLGPKHLQVVQSQALQRPLRCHVKSALNLSSFPVIIYYATAVFTILLSSSILIETLFFWNFLFSYYVLGCLD
jgi:hypothetical protein